MATTRNSLPRTGKQSEAVQILNQLMDTSEVLEVCPEGTTESEVTLVSDSVKIHVDTTGQTALEAIVINPADETLNKQQKRRPTKTTCISNIPSTTVPLIQDAIINRQPGELTPSMKLAIRSERTKRLRELLDSKLHNGLGLPKMKNCKRGKWVAKNKSQIGKGRTLLECSSSHKSFHTAEDLSEHQQTKHVENGLLDCEKNVHQCGHKSTDENSLKNHTCVSLHFIKEFICDICGESFSNKIGLTSHIVRHSKMRPFQCPLCNLSFKRQGDLRRHRITHTSERPHVCTVCGKDFRLRGAFLSHMRNVHGIDPPILPNKKFHVASPERPHVCHCGVAYKTWIGLNNHKKDLHGIIHPEASTDRPLVCQCGADFKLQHNLLSHQEKIHGINAMPPVQPQKTREAQEPKNYLAYTEEQVNKDKTFECQPCKRSFQSAETLSRHQQSDHPLGKRGKCHLCSFCGETFARRWQLSDHQILHTGVLHLCPHCGYQCTKKGTMAYHLKRHFPSKRKYVCDICGSSFFEKYKLKCHQALHSDERPFQCDECEKAFKTYTLLKLHQGTHQTERPHICWCAASFKSKRALRVHSKKVHGSLEACQQNGEVTDISLENLTAQTAAKAAEETIHLAGGNKHRRTKTQGKS